MFLVTKNDVVSDAEFETIAIARDASADVDASMMEAANPRTFTDFNVHSGRPPHLTSPPKTGERDKMRQYRMRNYEMRNYEMRNYKMRH